MARPAADGVKVVWTGTGTGTLSLGSAAAGWQGFPSTLSGFAISYAIEHENGLERETGLGTYTSAGNTLSRDLVSFSTAIAPTKQNFSAGNKIVRLGPLVQDVLENRATTDPGTGDDIGDGYVAGRSRWLNTTTGSLFFCTSHAAGAATWVKLGTAALISPQANNDLAGYPAMFVWVGTEANFAGLPSHTDDTIYFAHA